jgi:DNA polymerase
MNFIDFETYYTQEYTLKKLNYYQYVQDHRFSILGAAVIHNDDPAQWLTGLDLATFLDELRRNPYDGIVAHNEFFDGLILTQLGITTELWVDTLSMARALLPPGTPLSLDALAKRYNLGQKLEGLPMGITSWDELSPEAQRRLKYYAINDVELLKKLYHKLAPEFPSKEFELVDLTMRMAFTPHLQLNIPLAQQLLASVGDRKTKLINESGLSEKVLSSNKQFSEWLLANNYDVPMKVSPTTGKQTPALGQSDQAFLDLLEDNPELEPIIEARLAVKSTLETTRLTTLIETQQLMGGIPVPLKYYGTHTGRWSGQIYNAQNLPKTEIRNTLRSPEDETLIIADSAAIEARILAWLAGQEDILTIYRAGGSPYKTMAANIYAIEETQVTEPQRTLGKIAVLGCGYGMGAPKFQRTCKTYNVTIDIDLAQTTVTAYRDIYYKVRNLWYTFDSYLQVMTTDFAKKSGKTPWLEYTAPNETLTTLIFTTEKIILPNGLALHYPNLRQNDQGEYVYGLNNSIKKLYGAKTVENVTQALARNFIAQQMLDAHKTLPGTLVLSVHDEIVISTKTQYAESVLQDLITIMKTPPNWASTCPLDAEGSISKFYKK